MASTYTNSLLLDKQGTGDNSSTWGAVANTDFDLIDNAIAGMTTVAVTGGTDTLTATSGAANESRAAMLKFTGVLASAETVVVPTVTKKYVVWNATSGSYTLTVKTVAGTGIVIPQGYIAVVACDGTNVINGLSSAMLSIIADTNGNELMKFTTTASAVNEVTLTNAATGNAPVLEPTGGDTNISLKLQGKGTGSVYGNQETIAVAVSDETTSITTGTAKITFHMPYAFKLMKVKAGLSTASSSGNPAVDLNDDGVSVFTTTVTIDANETFSDTAATASALTSTPLSIASGSVMTVDIDTAGTGARGLKIYLIGYPTAAA